MVLMHITKLGQRIFEDSNLGTLIDLCYIPMCFRERRHLQTHAPQRRRNSIDWNVTLIP